MNSLYSHSMPASCQNGRMISSWIIGLQSTCEDIMILYQCFEMIYEHNYNDYLS